MESDSSTTVLLGLVLLFANAFFVAAEYALVGARRSRIEALAKRGNRQARHVVRAIDERSRYIAAVQIGITIVGIGLGALTEPFLARKLEALVDALPLQVASTLAILIVTYPMVVIGELVPKMVTLRYSDRVALVLIEPLRLVVPLLTPLTWFFQLTSALLLKPFKIDVYAEKRQGMSREELALLVQESHDGGEFDESHAQFLTKTLRFDTLDSEDVMVHRLDIQWLDVETPRDALPNRIKKIRHSRIPVCKGDLDEVVGIVYVQDILAHWSDEDFSLDRLMREPEFVPETLTLDRIVAHMRDAKTQIVIVRDEYGGTSGLVTLEDVVEEIFGDLEDRLESERPSIEQTSDVRVIARADVRYDELLGFLRIESIDSPLTTETLAAIIVDSVGRVPRIGDSVALPIGTLKVENMARQRITRLAVYLDRSLTHPGRTAD